MVVVIHDSALGDVRELSDFTLDLAFGSDENSFTLECDAALAPNEGQFAFVDGCEYGGVVDEATYDAGRAVAIDTETLGLNPHRDRLCVVQISRGDGDADVVQILPLTAVEKLRTAAEEGIHRS